ncbi:methyltransferase domain-containing protein [Flavobacteriaceae bacterium R38]|nr:methyltransferase domain-containing protein [Flavobacteriaceae bacterium R38]
MKDLFGQAILDYQSGNYTEDIFTETSISEEDVLPIPYLFRSYEEMPQIEQKALELAYGNVLDVGCGTGSHSLYLQNKRHLNVTALDISKGAVDVCKKRGVHKVLHDDIMNLKTGSYDTILLLMNGTGIFGQLKNVSSALQHLKSLLNKGGQILIDSSDIIYMFDQDEDGGRWIPTETDYYGEVKYTLRYKGEENPPFNWLYLDFNTLKNAALANDLNCELILEGDHYDFLAKLSVLE